LRQRLLIKVYALGYSHHYFIVIRIKLLRSGGRGRDRTYDQSIKSRMLYQLSYASFWFLLLERRPVRAFAEGLKHARLQSLDLLKITQLAGENGHCKL
jgi:hypothetical protein